MSAEMLLSFCFFLSVAQENLVITDLHHHHQAVRIPAGGYLYDVSYDLLADCERTEVAEARSHDRPVVWPLLLLLAAVAAATTTFRPDWNRLQGLARARVEVSAAAPQPTDHRP